MRTAICIALATMAITMFGCDWFTSKNKTSTAFNIEGEWKLDSLQEGSDSSRPFRWLGLAGFINEINETSEVMYNFNKDSVVAQISPALPVVSYYAYDSKENQLIVKADSSENKFSFTAISDSLFSLTGVDNSVVWLKRQ